MPFVFCVALGWNRLFQSKPISLKWRTPEDAHGIPGYPRDSEEDKAHSVPSTRPSNGEPETGTDTLEQGNDNVD
jgi:hypothetical protein